MKTLSAFDLDCTPIIPACEFRCDQCVREIQSVLGKMPGVESVRLAGDDKDQHLVVGHDLSQTSIEALTTQLASLPSFYEGSFLPSVRGG